MFKRWEKKKRVDVHHRCLRHWQLSQAYRHCTGIQYGGICDAEDEGQAECCGGRGYWSCVKERKGRDVMSFIHCIINPGEAGIMTIIVSIHKPLFLSFSSHPLSSAWLYSLPTLCGSAFHSAGRRFLLRRENTAVKTLDVEHAIKK